MKKRLASLFIVFLAVVIALASGGNTIPGKAAGADVPLMLIPSSVYIPSYGSGGPSLKWWIHLLLTDVSKWSGSSSFIGILHVEVTGSTSSSSDTPFKCAVLGAGTITPPSVTGQPVIFNGKYLKCDLPSIKDKALGLGYTPPIPDYLDFKDPIGGGSSDILQVTIEKMQGYTTTSPIGTILDHPSIKLMHPSSTQYKAEIYDGTDPGWFTTISPAATIPSGPPSTITFEVVPYESFWKKPSTMFSVSNLRSGKSFAWYMNKIPFSPTPPSPSKKFTIGDGFYGKLGNLSIDPRTSQSTSKVNEHHSVSIATQDGWTGESSENSNVGGTMNAAATTISLGDDAVRKQYRSLLSFNTSSLPDTAVITGMILKVKKQAIVGGGNPVNIFQGFIVDIKNGFFGAKPALEIKDFQAPASHTYGPFQPTPVNDWYSINLNAGSAYINKLVKNGGLTQIRLRFQLDDNNDAIANYLSLYSGDAVNTADRPQLEISYYVP